MCVCVLSCNEKVCGFGVCVFVMSEYHAISLVLLATAESGKLVGLMLGGKCALGGEQRPKTILIAWHELLAGLIRSRLSELAVSLRKL